MRADTPTKTSLWDFARVLGMNPLHFAGIQWAPSSRRTPSCAQPYFQYPWQDADRTSRDEVAQALFEAETLIERALHARLMPSWERDEFHPLLKPGPGELVNYTGTDQRGYPIAVVSDWGHGISGGIRGLEVLEAAADIVWSDPDSVGFDTLGTITVTIAAGALPAGVCEVRVYHPDHDGDPAWEIKPLERVTLSGQTLTILVRRELCVKASVYDTYSQDNTGVDPTDATKFLATADVYREYNDRRTQAISLWEPFGICQTCVDGSCGRCEWSVQTGCLLPRDWRRGSYSIRPANWDEDDEVFSYSTWSGWKMPDAVRLYYYAGLQDKSQQCGNKDLSREWKRTIVGLACAQLDRPPCDCTADQWQYYREDLSQDQGSDDFGTFRTPDGQLNNLFGTRRGALEAWRKVYMAHDRIGMGLGVG